MRNPACVFLAVVLAAGLCSCSMVRKAEGAIDKANEIQAKIIEVMSQFNSMLAVVRQSMEEAKALARDASAAAATIRAEADTDKDGKLSIEEILLYLGFAGGGGVLTKLLGLGKNRKGGAPA